MTDTLTLRVQAAFPSPPPPLPAPLAQPQLSGVGKGGRGGPGRWGLLPAVPVTLGVREAEEGAGVERERWLKARG